MSKQLLFLMTTLILIGCGTQYDNETPSGIGITFLERGNIEDSLESGNVVALHAFYRTDDDRDLVKTAPGQPLYIQFDRNYTIEQGGYIQEVIEALYVGDSVYFELPSKNLWEKSFRRSLPDSIDEASNVKVNLRVHDQMSMREYGEMMTKMERERNAEAYDREKEMLTAFLKDNNLEPQMLESGLGYIKQNTLQGPLPQESQTVNVKYKGMLLDGSVFDQGTYAFPLGHGQVIAGWDEGIAYFRKGEKGILYVPSELGYGSRGSNPNIPPFSSLIFEVEVLDIK
jgi:FKBP-type peptidyl-prolyl cis-trans isomerase FkpA